MVDARPSTTRRAIVRVEADGSTPVTRHPYVEQGEHIAARAAPDHEHVIGRPHELKNNFEFRWKESAEDVGVLGEECAPGAFDSRPQVAQVQ